MAEGMLDVLVVGAGPAGSVAATVLARAGARVRLVDRATFPREKLCGDTLNPGTLALLGRLQMDAGIHARGLRIDGMRVTGDGGIDVRAQYGHGLHGRALTRRDLDWLLVQHAIDAGAAFEPGVAVRAPIVEEQRGVARVAGVRTGTNGDAHELRARVTIAADGRHSTLAFALGLARHPKTPRRWAVGAYYQDVADLGHAGEMHIRRGRYIGIAPLPGGLANACVVLPAGADLRTVRDPAAFLAQEIARDVGLRERFAGARAVGRATVLGPLAVDAADRAVDGLLLAGDAAGFIDPMTGDGLRFAVRGAELAAAAALSALTDGWHGVHGTLASKRRAEFSGKWRFNRGLRALVGSRIALRGAAFGARLAPSVLESIVLHAGDCALAQP
jgi:flavin-dependent dehydrogenase